MSIGATGPIMKAISKRRSHRDQWRIFERIAMVILDAWLIWVSFRLAYYLRLYLISQDTFISRLFNNIRNNLIDNSSHGKAVLAPISSFQSLEFGIVIGLIIIFAFRGLYKMRLTGSWFRQVWTIVSSSTIGLAFLITYYFVMQPTANSRLLAPFVWIAAIVLLSFGRLVVSATMAILYRLGLAETRLLVVGSGRLGKMIMQHIAASPNLGYSIVGFLSDMDEPLNDFGRFKLLGTLEDLRLVILSMQVDEVIIALPSNMHEQSIKSVRLCERLGASFKLIPDLHELSLSRIDMATIEGIPLLNIRQVSLNRWQQAVTRVVDVTLSLLMLTLGIPIWLCIALAIRIDSPGEVVYRQTRIGQGGKLFRVYKFRSMYKNADQIVSRLMTQNEAQGPLFKMKSDPRITPVGKFLRRTSIDEFPQLINVLRGEMSLVGPRPPLPQEVMQYEGWQKARLDIKPGMTGLWQVRGRSDLSFDEGVLLDLYYISNWSLRLYFQILLRTIPAVLLRRGAY
ncbi:MAG TPA: sugar transferase [Ktedonobacteraceae bacterium]|nr:sugar transferase [Ktedonobacteraceae bacterium]